MMSNRTIAVKSKDFKEVAQIIADNMLTTRHRAEPIYTKRRKIEYVHDLSPLGARCINLKGIYPDAKKGDCVYVATILETKKPVKAALKTTGCEKIFLDGQEYKIDGNGVVEFDIKEGQTLAEFYCECNETFEMSFVPSICYYPGMWARDYLVHIRALSPIKGFEGQEGVGVTSLCGKRDEYVYPKAEKQKNEIDFNTLYAEDNGFYAYGITYAASDTEAEFNVKGKGKIFVNNMAVSESKISLKKNDLVVIKCERGKVWGFDFSGDLYIPVIPDEKILTVGLFGKEAAIDVKYGPELYLDYTKPYRNADGKRCFFKTGTKNDYLTVEMHTYFYSQWFYALMVGEYGLLDAARLTGNDEYQQYFIDSIGTMADFYEQQKWHKETFGDSAFLQRGMTPNDLDSIGSIGMNMCELFSLVGSKSALECAEMLAESIKWIPRFDDGTFNRGTTMWADDTYMSCPFMLRYGLLKDDEYWLGECVRQLLGFADKLFIEDKNVFSHIYFVNEKTPNRIPWGRGNGWVFLTLSEIIEKLPKKIKDYDKLVELFKRFATGVIKLQGDNGLWHQVLDIPTSYEETSCTGMFIIGLSRGVRLGLLDESVKENINRAYVGLLENKIDEDGNLYDVCRGSWCSMEAKYYIQLGTVDNDDHGTGIILSALYEMQKLYSV